MSLPKSVMRTDKVELTGGWVELRPLSFTEVTEVQRFTGADQNCLAISYATGENLAAVEEWYHSPGTSAGDVAKLCDAIGKLSGLDEAARFQSATGDDVVVEPAAT